jgi:hypothetical protein
LEQAFLPECKVRLLAIRLIPAINSPIVERKKPLDNLQGLKLFFVAANEGRTDPPPKSVKLFIAYKCLLCQEKYFLLLA